MIRLLLSLGPLPVDLYTGVKANRRDSGRPNPKPNPVRRRAAWIALPIALASVALCRMSDRSPGDALHAGMTVAQIASAAPGFYTATRSPGMFPDARLAKAAALNRFTGSIRFTDPARTALRWRVEKGRITDAIPSAPVPKAGASLTAALAALGTDARPRLVPNGAETFNLELPRDLAKLADHTGTLVGSDLTVSRTFLWSLTVRRGRVLAVESSQRYD